MVRNLVLFFGVICLSLMLLPACAPQAEQQAEPAADEAASTQADVEAIKDFNIRLIDALNSRDASAVVALVTDDAADLPPNRPAVIGKEAIREFVQSDYDQFTTYNFVDEIVEVEAAGDLAVVWSNFTVKLIPKGSTESMEDSGKWIKVLKRQPDGSWKYSRGIWNSDNPASGEPTT
jgi:uncharacterized protein (TIGR02246 family)